MNRSKLISLFVAMVLIAPLTASGTATANADVARVKPVKDTLVVTIDAPVAGATVSDTTTILVSVTDPQGVHNDLIADIYIDDTFIVSANAYDWDTTTYIDGDHKIRAYAVQPVPTKAKPVKVISDEDIITVSVSNGGSGSNVLTSGVPVQGYLAAKDAEEMWTIEVAANCETMYSVLTHAAGPTIDFDLYGKLGSEPTTSSYDWRGYTTGGEEVTTEFPGAGTWYIMAQSYKGSGDYELTVTLTDGTPPVWGDGGLYAIIVGISDYASISDLSYCDEDATDWYNQITPMGYESHVYGDGHIEDYPRHDGKASEARVRNDMQTLAAHATAGDTVLFITSGHGSGDGSGSSYLCMWDCSGTAGCYYDTELADDVSLFASGVNIFVFIDHCYAGGMGPELMALPHADTIYVATTCTEDGYGYDDGTNHNGMWTYYFLDYSWQTHFTNNPDQSMESVFDYALANYPKSGGDTPQEFDGNAASAFYL